MQKVEDKTYQNAYFISFSSSAIIKKIIIK